MMQFVLYVIITFILSIAIWNDIKYYKVPNVLIVFGIWSSFLYRLFNEGISSIGAWLLGILIPGLVLFIFFRFRMIGAGDIKLCAVIGGFFSAIFALKVIVVAFIIGAILAIFQMIRYQNLFIRLQYLAAYISQGIREKQWKPYYISCRDGQECTIHFTIAISLAVIICCYEQLL